VAQAVRDVLKANRLPRYERSAQERYAQERRLEIARIPIVNDVIVRGDRTDRGVRLVARASQHGVAMGGRAVLVYLAAVAWILPGGDIQRRPGRPIGQDKITAAPVLVILKSRLLLEIGQN